MPHCPRKVAREIMGPECVTHYMRKQAAREGRGVGGLTCIMSCSFAAEPPAALLAWMTLLKMAASSSLALHPAHAVRPPLCDDRAIGKVFLVTYPSPAM